VREARRRAPACALPRDSTEPLPDRRAGVRPRRMCDRRPGHPREAVRPQPRAS
jgi:hypothetical protein